MITSESPRPDPDGLIERMLEALNDEDQVIKRLTPWEIDFLENVTTEFQATGTLSSARAAKLEQIYAEKTA